MNMLVENNTQLIEKQSQEVFYPELYNNLQPIMEADQSLKARTGLDNLLEEMGELICEFKLENHIGLCLLHNHNLVEENHFMCEHLDSTRYSSQALVMEHTNRSEVSNVHVPVAIKVTGDNQLAALEFSTVDLAIENYQIFAEQREQFMPRFSEVLIKHDFHDLIGLSILRTDALKPAKDEILLEQSEMRMANILMISKHDPAANHVQTNWQFEMVAIEPESDESKVGVYAAAKCKPANYCKSYCDLGEDGKKHKPIHDQISHVSEVE